MKCLTGKRPYHSYQEARNERSTPDWNYPYKCPFCKNFHTTSSIPQNERGKILREEQEFDFNLYGIHYSKVKAEQHYQKLLNDGARVKLVYKQSKLRYEIRIV